MGARVPVGKSGAFVWYLVGRNANSHAVITGVTVPHIQGLRLRLQRVMGPPHAGGEWGVLPQTASHPGGVSLSQLRPLVGAHLRLQPWGAGLTTTGLAFALVATPTRPGCYTINGPVTIRYRVGDSTFSRSLNGTDWVSTRTDDSCGNLMPG